MSTSRFWNISQSMSRIKKTFGWFDWRWSRTTCPLVRFPCSSMSAWKVTSSVIISGLKKTPATNASQGLYAAKLFMFKANIPPSILFKNLIHSEFNFPSLFSLQSWENKKKKWANNIIKMTRVNKKTLIDSYVRYFGFEASFPWQEPHRLGNVVQYNMHTFWICVKIKLGLRGDVSLSWIKMY